MGWLLYVKIYFQGLSIWNWFDKIKYDIIEQIDQNERKVGNLVWEIGLIYIIIPRSTAKFYSFDQELYP